MRAASPWDVLRLLLFLALTWTAPRCCALERWFYVSQNLAVNQNVTNLVNLMQQASHAGYTHMLLNDSKFCHLLSQGSWYFQNLNFIKQTATNLNLEIVPAVFPVGYANDLLFNNPNLIEGMPVSNALLVVSNGAAVIQPDPPVAFPAGGFATVNYAD